ncbi:MAG: hypothetical protein MHPSP_004159, partial [Paramarteilia canceri]
KLDAAKEILTLRNPFESVLNQFSNKWNALYGSKEKIVTTSILDSIPMEFHNNTLNFSFKQPHLTCCEPITGPDLLKEKFYENKTISSILMLSNDVSSIGKFRNIDEPKDINYFNFIDFVKDKISTELQTKNLDFGLNNRMYDFVKEKYAEDGKFFIYSSDGYSKYLTQLLTESKLMLKDKQFLGANGFEEQDYQIMTEIISNYLYK